MGTLGPTMDIGASGHRGQMGTWGEWAPAKMSTRANGHWGQMGTVEQMGTLGPMDIGALGGNGHQEKRAPEQMGIGQLGKMSS